MFVGTNKLRLQVSSSQKNLLASNLALQLASELPNPSLDRRRWQKESWSSNIPLVQSTAHVSKTAGPRPGKHNKKFVSKHARSLQHTNKYKYKHIQRKLHWSQTTNAKIFTESIPSRKLGEHAKCTTCPQCTSQTTVTMYAVTLVTFHSALQTNLTNVPDNSNVSLECIQICIEITKFKYCSAHWASRNLQKRGICWRQQDSHYIPSVFI